MVSTGAFVGVVVPMFLILLVLLAFVAWYFLKGRHEEGSQHNKQRTESHSPSRNNNANHTRTTNSVNATPAAAYTSPPPRTVTTAPTPYQSSTYQSKPTPAPYQNPIPPTAYQPAPMQPTPLQGTAVSREQVTAALDHPQAPTRLPPAFAATPRGSKPIPPPPEEGGQSAWKWIPDAGLYWGQSEYLFFDPYSKRSYDPESGQWYNPETSEWAFV